MQAQLINEAINLLTEGGLEFHGVTFDGCAENIATARCLACKIVSLVALLNTQHGKTRHCLLFWMCAICLNWHETV